MGALAGASPPNSSFDENIREIRASSEFRDIAEKVAAGKCIVFLGAMAHARPPDNCPYAYSAAPKQTCEPGQFWFEDDQLKVFPTAIPGSTLSVYIDEISSSRKLVKLIIVEEPGVTDGAQTLRISEGVFRKRYPRGQFQEISLNLRVPGEDRRSLTLRNGVRLNVELVDLNPKGADTADLRLCVAPAPR